MMNEKQNIGSLFDRIARTYDFVNHFLSLNIDKWWRRKAVKDLGKGGCPELQCLDVAIGTADLAIALAHRLEKRGTAFQITGIDLSAEMMRIGEEKVQRQNLAQRITFMQASALEMPFEDNSFDVVTCSYGVRNFSDLHKGLSEMQRVLKPGGELMILEFSYPENKVMAWAYDLYFSHVMPRVGRLLSKDKTAFNYFNRSVKNFVWGEEMCECLRAAGFSSVTHRPLTFGISTIYRATKENPSMK